MALVFPSVKGVEEHGPQGLTSWGRVLVIHPKRPVSCPGSCWAGRGHCPISPDLVRLFFRRTLLHAPAVTVAMSRIPRPAGRLQLPLLGERPQEPLIGKVSKPIGVKDLGKSACEGQFPTGGWETLSPRWSVYGRN